MRKKEAISTHALMRTTTKQRASIFQAVAEFSGMCRGGHHSANAHACTHLHGHVVAPETCASPVHSLHAGQDDIAAKQWEQSMQSQQQDKEMLRHMC